MLMMKLRCGKRGLSTGYLHVTAPACDELTLTPDCGEPVSTEP